MRRATETETEMKLLDETAWDLYRVGNCMETDTQRTIQIFDFPVNFG